MANLKATPRIRSTGFNDNTGGVLSIQPEEIPQHLPIIYLMTERGDENPQLVIGDSFNRNYGASSLSPTSPFATHQSKLAAEVMSEGNQVLVKRIVPTNATKAMLRISVELIPTELPIYVRAADGSIVYQPSVNGGTEPVVDSLQIGHRVVWHATTEGYATAAKGFGAGTVIQNFRSGEITANGVVFGEIDGEATSSTLYPIIDLEVSTKGGFGNNVGIRFGAPTTESNTPADITMTEAVRSYIYSLTCVERLTPTSNPNIIKTNGGDVSLDLVLKQNVNETRLNRPISIEDILIKSYQELDTADTPPKRGPFGRVNVYNSNLNTVLDLLINGTTAGTDPVSGEKEYDGVAAAFGRSLPFADSQNRHLLNLFTGVDYNNVPYYAFDVSHSVLFGGITFQNDSVVYATGGSDGLFYDINGRPDNDKNLELFDSLVRDQLANFGDLEDTLLDVARYPISAIWDSGFSLETKKALINVMARRKDVTVFLSTHSVADHIASNAPNAVNGKIWERMPQNDESTELAIATSLSNTALLTPESVIFATPACRATIIGHSGELIDTSWRGFYPLTIDVAKKVARYMGASNGQYSRGDQFDEESGNRVELFKVSSVNLTYKSDTNYDRAWDSGVVWVQYADTKTLFYPAFQTVYPDSSSIFNSLIVVMAASELTKVAHRVWTRLVGNTRLKPAAFISRSDELIIEGTNGRFDDRFRIVPRTIYTKADEERAYSWTTEISIYSNAMKTVNTLTINGELEDYANAA